MRKIDKLLQFAVQQKASDIILMSGSPPFIRIQGDLIAVNMPPLGQAAVKHLLAELLTPEQSAVLQKNTNIDLSYAIPNVARFRINCLMQRLGYGVVARIIPLEVPDLESLGLPSSVVELLNMPNGLILVTGPSGSGKTTTQFSIINRIASMRKDHILTIEDPIEFALKSKSCLINQRELGSHTESFATALRAALREDPDIILIGEMRDTETISLAITASETGHLVLGTLNTLSAMATVNRVIDSFPGDQKAQIRLMLSGSLRSVISQRLVKAKAGKERVMAAEILINTKNVANLIREGKTILIQNAMQMGKSQGMVTMDASLAQLAKEEKISLEEATQNAENVEEVKKLITMKPGANAAA